MKETKNVVVPVEIDTTSIEKTIEKANLLKDTLAEVTSLINSLGGTTVINNFSNKCMDAKEFFSRLEKAIHDTIQEL